MNSQQLALYDRIQTFKLDEEHVKVTFKQRLVREQYWTPTYTERVIDEYRKFLLLAMITGHRVVPSDQVDQVWHLHLTNSRSYWQELCPNILGKALHHQPNLGNQVETNSHIQDYNQTLSNYEKIFGQKAPDDIWPPVNIRFGRDLNFIRVNTYQYWMIPKPWSYWKRRQG